MTIGGINLSMSGELLRKNLTDKTSLLIILHNIFPILGVIFYYWDPISIVFLYISETIVIGLFNILKMLISQKDVKLTNATYKHLNLRGRLSMAAFFFVHYNMFIVAQIIIIVPDARGGDGFLAELLYFANYFLKNDSMLIALGLVTATHLFSLLFDYLGKKEYKIYSPLTLMFFPYGRIFIQHFVGLVGVFFMEVFGLPFFLLIFLQLFKGAGELFTHFYLIPKYKSPLEFSTYPEEV